jgi:hypothetical protein
MFKYKAPPAFILRLAVFALLFSSYPLVYLFLYDMILVVGKVEGQLSRKTDLIANLGINAIPLLFVFFD